ncbi:SIMPL domain-containing protein [Piscinibacter sakaiensis]|uniref:Putative exported protein n=1 Tax=Piscinibacter sakaiensis TaxID=1547922 RepID=A0A0K8P3N4_PISS1|nr:SIMPL domain-containing protein [Piscinibacter sakaiensis]GAP37186.1 putative exported protein [Piscinibacter sakaiensis]
MNRLRTLSPRDLPAPRAWRPAAALLLAAVAAAQALPARADTAPPQGVVNLTASASTEVAKDWIAITLSTQREGAEAGPVQTALKQALDAALQQARAAARPGQVEVQTGPFSLSPRYTNQGRTNGWQGVAELVIEGRDMAAIGQLAGRISSLSISRVAYGLSREAREKAEAEITAQAVARWRERAAESARLFGYTSYALREVSVGSNEPPPMMPMVRAKAMAAMAPADEALPIEAGKATVTVSVNGSVQLLK